MLCVEHGTSSFKDLVKTFNLRYRHYRWWPVLHRRCLTFLFFSPLHSKTRDKRHGQHGQHKLVVWLHRKFTSMLLFLFKLQLVSVAVSTSHDDKLFHSHDTGVMSHWHHDDRIITDNHLLFLGKVSFSCSQWCLQTICFLLPHPYPLALAVNKSPADLFFITCAWRTLKRNRGSVNRLYW